MAELPPASPPRFPDPAVRTEMDRVGLSRHWFKDLYQRLMEASWAQLLALVFASYLVVNVLFASLYLATGGGIENARPGDFLDAFFFSIQTIATVGYGKLVPVTVLANTIAAVEILLGLLGVAMITGLMFAKFARPTAAVMFSDKMVVTMFDRKPVIQFRVANERSSQIVEAQLRFVMMRGGQTAEGQPIRRLIDLGLQRSHNAFFALTWLAVHPIDEQSPFYGMTVEQLLAEDINFVASLTGIEEISGQTVHARHWYGLQDLVVDHKFVDIIGLGDSGRRQIDFGRFHHTEPAPSSVAMPLGSPHLLAAAPKVG